MLCSVHIYIYFIFSLYQIGSEKEMHFFCKKFTIKNIKKYKKKFFLMITTDKDIKSNQNK